MDNDNVRGVAQIRFDPKTNELIAADGYGNHRVSVWDPDTLKFKRAWGAYGKPPTDDTLPPTSRVSRPRSSSATRCTALSRPRTAWSTSATASTIASRFSRPTAPSSRKYFSRRTPGATARCGRSRFSKDAQEKYIYVADGANHKIHVFDRQSMTELYSFGSGGRQPGEWYAVAQHRHRLEGQHLYDGDLSRPARPEVQLQGHLAR